MIKPFHLFTTDYYQLSMTLAYILRDMGADVVGFEGFCRDIRDDVAGSAPHYVFAGEEKVHTFIEVVRQELEDPALLDTFLGLVLPKVPHERREVYETFVRNKWGTLPRSFEYSVMSEGGSVRPFVPFFQFRGPRWIGQLLETQILLMTNGRTGLKTREVLGRADVPLHTLRALVTPGDDVRTTRAFLNYLKNRARAFRDATSCVLLEAGFRRAPSLYVAVEAARIALEEGWDGTSNVAAHFYRRIPLESVGGTMAHSFVMGHDTEEEAFEAWTTLFPGSTVLIDTYNVESAVRTLTRRDLKPGDVRIDSDPLDHHCRVVRAAFDEKGWNDVGIFASGDVSPEMLQRFHRERVPFDKTMAGTNYVCSGLAKYINCGFVYKLVEQEVNGIKTYPRKKSNGKGNHPGLKTVRFDGEEIVVICNGDGFGIDPLIGNISPTTPIRFDTEGV